MNVYLENVSGVGTVTADMIIVWESKSKSGTSHCPIEMF